MAETDVPLKLTSMIMSMGWYKIALKDLERELSLPCPSDLAGDLAKTVRKRKETVWFYTRLLSQECRSTIHLLDLTVEAVTELSQAIHSRLGWKPEKRKHFEPTCIPSEAGLPTALETASERCKIPIIMLRSYFRSLDSAALPYDEAIQSAMKEIKHHYAAILLKCDILKLLFDFKARYIRNMIHDRRTKREQHLERRDDNMATDAKV